MRFSILLLALGIASCSTKPPRDAEAFVAFCENESNGLRKTKKIGSAEFSVQYQPGNYMLAKRQLHGLAEAGKNNANSAELQHFLLRIELEGESDPLRAGINNINDYSKRLEYLSFYINQDIVLVDGMDTFACVLAHLERLHNIAPYVNISIAFESHSDETPAEIDRDKLLIYDDKIFGGGILKFLFQSKDIQAISSVKTI